MQEVLLLRYGEIFLKGKNFNFFERTLLNNIKRAVKPYGAAVSRGGARIIVERFDPSLREHLIERIKKIFGIVSLSVALSIKTAESAIIDIIKTIKITTQTFKVETRRADKNFPIKSYEFSAKMGDIILENNPHAKVDVHNPKSTVHIDIRENGTTFVYHQKLPCYGGMPVGTAGQGMLMLSGGIDSPVAGFMMAKRGLNIMAIHFHSYPYTSEQAKQKVITLSKLMTPYTGSIKLIIVPFTKIQEEIHKNCDSEYMVTFTRRFMFRIAERLGKQNHCSAIITGESLGQVASQTIEGLTASNGVVETLPVLRPLIGFDKTDIIAISKNIGTYETSILPYEDCCSVFLPKSPVTKPKTTRIELNEKFLDIEALIDEAIAGAESMIIEDGH
ncbi:MAG: tRNA 4-thiouridine(8) synthase ThiI [Christensenellaceae bacterium]|jgi:thiamine biosynthesis protein ThiI|nr:tRNA 4-thiouridine(8) synthase ThiI [Christensenellaceae bacterium]